MARPPIIVLAGRHRPHEQLLLGWSAFSGATQLFSASEPASITAAMPGVLVILWSVGLLLSGVIGLAGCWMHGERGQLLEAGGLLIGAGALLVFAAAALALVGSSRALFQSGLVLAWLAANLVRANQIRKDLRAIKDAVP